MKDVIAFLAGKKTHLLVAVAVLLVLGGAMDPNTLELQGGLDFSEVDFNRLLQAVGVAVVSTVKAAYDRKQS